MRATPASPTENAVSAQSSVMSISSRRVTGNTHQADFFVPRNGLSVTAADQSLGDPSGGPPNGKRVAAHSGEQVEIDFRKAQWCVIGREHGSDAETTQGAVQDIDAVASVRSQREIDG